MNPQYHGSFDNLNFPKTGREIKEKVNQMIEARIKKIGERETRIKGMIEAKGLTAVDFFADPDEFNQTSYSNTTSFNAGELGALKTESHAIRQDRQELDKLQLISKNLPDSETFKLDFAELSYFGF